MRKLPFATLRAGSRSDALVILGFLVAAIAFLWSVTVGGKILLPTDNIYSFPPFKGMVDGSIIPHNLLISDMLLQNISWKNLARDAILNGSLPLWNPYIFAGVPFMAAGQSGSIYPLGAIFYLLRPEYAYGWFTALHLFLAGVFTYIYLRMIGVRRFGGLIGGITFMFSGFLVVSFLWPMVVSTAIWIPLLLAAIEGMIAGEEGRGRRQEVGGPAAQQGQGLLPIGNTNILLWPLIGAVGVGFQFLAGHMEISFYILFTMLYYAACRLVIMFVDTRDLWRFARASVMLLAMVAVGTGLAATQLLPFEEVIKENFRAGFVTYNDVIGWALPKIQAASFLMPDFFGNPTHHTYFDFFDWQTKLVGNNMLGAPTDPPGTIFWGTKNYVEGASYIGVLPLILAGAAVVFRRTRYTVIFASYAAFSLLLAFGAPLYAIFFYGVPGFDQLHTPFRWIYPFTISSAMLAGIGADALFSAEARENARRAGRRITEASLRMAYALIVSAVGLLVVGGVIAGIIFRSRTLSLAASFLARSQKLQQAFAGPEMLASYEMRNFLLFGLLAAASGILIWLAIGGRGPRRLWQALAVALVLADVFYFGIGFNTNGNARDLAVIPPPIAAIKSDKGVFRIATFGTDDILKPDLGMRYGLQDIRGYDTVILKQYVDFWQLMEPPDGLIYSMIKTLDKPESLSSKWLNLLNVKYILSSRPLSAPNLKPVYSGDTFVYRNTNYLPRAFLVDHVRPSTSSTQALAALRDPTFDPGVEAVIQGWPANNAGLKLTGARVVSQPRITSYGADKVTIETQNVDDAVLVLSDTYFIGWKATVDGHDATIYRADQNFRAIPLPAGTHQVIFRYSPLSVEVGLLGTLVSALVLLLGFAVVVGSRLFRRDVEATVQRIARNSFAPMSTSLLNKGMDVAFAMIMLRILGPDSVGKYVFATIIFTYFETITNFGLTTLTQREVAKDRSLSNTYLSNSLILRVLLVLMAVPVIIAFLYLWRTFFGLDGETMMAIVLLSISMVPSKVATAFSSLFYAHERMEYPAGVAVGSTLLKVALGTTALVAGWGIVGLAGVSVITNSVTALVLVVLVARVLLWPKLVIDGRLIRNMLRTSWPLMLNQLLANMFFRIDVPMLRSFRGDSEVGYYATAYKFIDGLNVIPSALTIALFPVLSRYADSSRESLIRAYSMALRLLLIVSMPIVVATVFLAEPIILFFGGPQYVPESVLALQVLIFFLPFSYVNSLTQYVLIAIDQQRFITISFVIATSFNFVANLVLIPRYGFVGAGAVTVLSEIVLMGPFLHAVSRHLGKVELVNLAIRPTVAAAIMGLVLWQLRGSEALMTAAIGAVVYVLALLAMRTFTANDADLARKVLGRAATSP